MEGGREGFHLAGPAVVAGGNKSGRTVGLVPWLQTSNAPEKMQNHSLPSLLDWARCAPSGATAVRCVEYSASEHAAQLVHAQNSAPPRFPETRQGAGRMVHASSPQRKNSRSLVLDVNVVSLAAHQAGEMNGRMVGSVGAVGWRAGTLSLWSLPVFFLSAGRTSFWCG